MNFFPKIHGGIRESKCTPGVNDTGGKCATSVNETDGKPVSTTPVAKIREAWSSRGERTHTVWINFLEAQAYTVLKSM
jgi:hypothetical protein